MRFQKFILISLLIYGSVIFAKAENKSEEFAEEPSFQPAMEVGNPELDSSADNSEKLIKEERPQLVIGKNLNIKMLLVDAFKLLGLPKSINVRRGTDIVFDSITIEYPKHGLDIHALNAGTTVEAIEVNQNFTGRFDTNIKMGDNFKLMIEKYGVPRSFESGVANYPNLRLFFILDKDKIVSAKVFAKGTKLLSNRLANSKK